MRQRCEVCESYRPETELALAQQLIVVNFGQRAVLLCRGHARIAARSGVSSFEGLREFYGAGRRSFVSRRGLDGSSGSSDRRKSPGRRATDAR